MDVISVFFNDKYLEQINHTDQYPNKVMTF
jgi:hypothetical protein